MPTRELMPDEIPIMAYPTLRTEEGLRATRALLASHGFFVMTELPFDIEMVGDRLYAAARKYFDAQPAQKRRAAFDSLDQRRFSNVGYFPHSSETPTASKRPDPKEFFHLGPDRTRLADPHRRDYGDLPASSIDGDFFRACRLAYEVLHALAIAAFMHVAEVLAPDGPEAVGFLTPNNNSILRVIHYPAKDALGDDPPEFRAAPHHGIQLLGIQMPPTSAGLEYLTPTGEWVAINTKVRDCVYVNIGRMLQHVSRGSVRATPHQVTFGDAAAAGESRFSAVFFFHPDHHAVAGQLDRTGEYVESPEMGRWGDVVRQKVRELDIGI